jgi:hypothetical protein
VRVPALLWVKKSQTHGYDGNTNSFARAAEWTYSKARRDPNQSNNSVKTMDKKMKFLMVIFALLLCANVHAQLRKCTAPDGRVTYSDVLCNSSENTGTIKNANGNTVGSGGGQVSSRCDVATKEYKEALATGTQVLKNIPLMPEYMAMNALCGPSSIASPEAPAGKDRAECAAALVAYKGALASKTHYVNQIKFMPEYILANTKCGKVGVQMPPAPRGGVLTQEVVEGLHKICVYSDGSSISVGGVSVCAMRN